MFKVNNKDTRTWFTSFANVFIIEFEQVFVCRGGIFFEHRCKNRSGATSSPAYLSAIREIYLKKIGLGTRTRSDVLKAKSKKIKEQYLT